MATSPRSTRSTARSGSAAAESAPPSIVIKAQPKKPLDIELVGVTYKVKPPKMAVLMAISRHAKDTSDPTASLRRIDDLISLMFGKNADVIHERLDDNDDDLDVDHIFELVEALSEDATADPTS